MFRTHLARVLVVDDNEMYRDILLPQYLRVCGFRHITRVEDGQQAADLLETHEQFGLIVTDLEMPKMNGIALIRQIKDNPLRRHIPVMMVCEPPAGQAEEVSDFLKQHGVPLLLKRSLSEAGFKAKLRELLKD